MRTLQLYGTGSASANAVANVVIPSAGTIRAILVAFFIDSITDNGQARVELSKIATSLFASNGAQDPFFNCAVQNNFVTSGMAAPAVNGLYAVDIQCRQGEIIYLHAFVSGTATYTFNGILYYG